MPSGLGVRPMASCQLHATWSMYSTGAGLNADFFAHADSIAAIGFEAVRIDVSWSESQPTEGTLPTAATQVIQRVTAAMNYMNTKGVKVFLTLWRAPDWAHPAVTGNSNIFPDSGHLTAWETWVTRMTDLFGGHAALLGLEIWNEPDLDQMSGAGADNATAYLPVLSRAYTGVKASTFPNTPVINGGPVAADWHYLEDLITQMEAANGGVANKYDILSFHPYPGNWKFRFDSYDYTGVTRDAANGWTQFRSAGGIKGVTWTGTTYVADSTSPNSILAMRTRHTDTRPMWVTEWGTSRAVDAATVAANRSITTTGVPGTWADVDAKWADYYVNAIDWCKDNVADITLFNYYTAWRPSSPDAGGSLSTDGMRILNADGTLTAAATALQTYFTANPTYRDPFGSSAPSGALPVFRVANTTTNDSASGTTTGSLAGISDGDLMLAVFASSDTVTGASLTPPAGWTVLRAHTSNGSSMSSWYGYRFKQSGDANPTWVLSASRDTQVIIAAYSGVDVTTPFDVTAFGSRPVSALTTDAPAVTTTGPNRLIVRLYGEKSSTTTAITDPAGHTRRAVAFGTGASTTSALALELAQATAGAVALATATYNAASSNGIAATLALNPTSVSTGSATLTAASGLTADGTVTRPGTAALSATGTLTATGDMSSIVATLAASGTLTATGGKVTTGLVTLTGGATLEATGATTRPQPLTPDGTKPGRIFVAGLARVFLGLVGTPVPTHPAGPFDPGLKEVGLFTRDSLKFSVALSYDSIKPHQSDYPVIDVESDRTEVVECDLQEWSANSFKSTYGGGQATETLPGVWTFTPPLRGGVAQPVMCVVQVVDNYRTYCLIIPKCVQLQGPVHGLGGDHESVLPLRLTIRQPDTGFPYWWVTDDDEAWRPLVPSSFLSYPGTNVWPSDSLFPTTP